MFLMGITSLANDDVSHTSCRSNATKSGLARYIYTETFTINPDFISWLFYFYAYLLSFVIYTQWMYICFLSHFYFSIFHVFFAFSFTCSYRQSSSDFWLDTIFSFSHAHVRSCHWSLRYAIRKMAAYFAVKVSVQTTRCEHKNHYRIYNLITINIVIIIVNICGIVLSTKITFLVVAET